MSTRSPSSAPATSASRSRRSSPRPASARSWSTSTPTRIAALNRGESYIEDVPSEELAPLVEAGTIAATTDYDALRETDAILDRAPDTALGSTVSPTSRSSSARQARSPSGSGQGHLVVLESTTYPGTTREDVLPLLALGRASRSARTSTWPSRPSASTRAAPTGRRRRRPRSSAAITEACTERGLRALRAGARHRHRRLLAGGRRADQAPREHLPLGQHRARQRARAALRPHARGRLGGRRGRRHEALRVHELQAGPWPGRPLPPRRPVLPLLEGAGVRLLHRVHRAGREGQREHAVLLPGEDHAGAQLEVERRSREAGAPASASPTRPTSATCASRPRSSWSSCCGTGAPIVSYHDPHVPELPEHGLVLGSRSTAPSSGRLRRHRHGALGHRLRRPGRARVARRRLPQRHGHERER